MLLVLPQWRPCPQHLVSEHPRFFNPLTVVISSQTTLLVLLSLKNGEKKDIHRVALHRVKSQPEASQSAILRPEIITTWSELSSGNPTQSCLIQLKRYSNRPCDAIHPLVITTRSRLVSKERPQIRASFGWPTFERISWIRPSHRCSHSKQNRPNNRYLVIGIQHTIQS